jgi:hypothetical protein
VERDDTLNRVILNNHDGDVYVESTGEHSEIVFKTPKVRVDGDVYAGGATEGLSSQVGSLRSLLSVTSGSQTEYKMVSYKPSYSERVGSYVYSSYSEYTDLPFGTSNSSFIDVVKREGVDNATIFETCLYATYKLTVYSYPCSSTNSWNCGGQTTKYMDIGKPASQAEVHQVDCVMEKLLNKLAESNWKAHSYHEYSDKHTLLFSRTTTT